MHFIYKQSGNFDCIIMQVWNLVYVYHHNPQTEKIWLWLDYSNTLAKKNTLQRITSVRAQQLVCLVNIHTQCAKETLFTAIINITIFF